MMNRALSCLFLLGSSCATPGAVTCPDGRTCPAGTECDLVHAICVEPDQLVVCVGQADGTACRFGSTDGVCEQAVCLVPACGNSIVDIGEGCDDGNQLALDGCSADCASDETCGNGVIDPIKGEQCDDGAGARSSDGCSSTCDLERPTWTEVTPRPIGGRFWYAMAYDAARKRVVVFGGHGDNDVLGDTWTWDGNGWSRVYPARSPSSRYGHAMAYDRTREVIVLFGGADGSGLRNDTWTWNGFEWTELAPAQAPPARYYGDMTFDRARNVAVLYGGQDGTGASFGDTWEWNGSLWTQKTTAASPGPLSFHAMAYDDFRQRVMLYGGDSPGGVKPQKTWEYDGTNWVDRAATPPSMVGRTAMAYDAVNRRIVLFGGAPTNFFPPSQQTWTWSGSQWTQAFPSQPPPARYSPAAAYDEDAQRVVVFGGYQLDSNFASTSLDDTWLWNGSNSSWNSPPVLPPSPEIRQDVVFAYDPVHGEALLYGGRGDQNQFYANVWAWRDRTWRELAPTGTTPNSRYAAAGAYDLDRERLVVFGGRDTSGALWVDDTWEWNGTMWSSPQPQVRPKPRIWASMTYDAARKLTLLIGGNSERSATPDDYGPLGDMWSWNGTTWTQLTPPTLPPPRSGTGLVYDPVRRVVVMFGGSDPSGDNAIAETWEWDGATWLQRTPAMSPPARRYHSMAYNAQRQRVTVVGGNNDTASLSDVWEWDGTTWAPLVADTPPTPRGGAGLIYDAVQRELVMFGGGLLRSRNDTWVLGFTTPGRDHERCLLEASDSDGDGLAGCADPDCWARCTPSCPPGSSCDATAARCGDGACAPIEDASICSMDCP